MGHELQDRVSMEIARRIAADLPVRPDWIALARENLRRWTERNHDAPGLLRCYAEWQAILEKPVDEVCRILTMENDEGQRLRQNSPFPGALPYKLIWEIKRQMRHDQNAA
ncbi:MAG: hypothetical protein JNM86_13550 [Phycisphaerae bacterium]|nr:hypothetical protein [Phycisphaerae bacterium]